LISKIVISFNDSINSFTSIFAILIFLLISYFLQLILMILLSAYPIRWTTV
jgi:hypothetical protein